MSISVAAGVQVFIGTTAAAENLSQFITDTYTEIGEVEDLGEFGDQAEEVTFASLSNPRLQKLKGVRDGGTLALICGSDDGDAGQDALIVAEADDVNDFNFKVILDDQLTVGGTPSEHFFRGKVMSKRLSVGTVNNVVRKTFNIGVNSEILSMDAS